ncbi:MAG: AI-2E family transporter [Deltaproteobacteria bacterium]|nr:AI-2E family transporter [Deltaproteobacteria bacterium]
MRWGVIIVVVLGLLTWLLWPVASMLIAATAIAYVLDPLVDRFERRGRSREIAIVVIFLVGLVLLGGLLALVIPALTSQVATLAGNIPGYLATAAADLRPAREWLQTTFNVDIPWNTEELQAQVPDLVRSISPATQATLKDYALKVLSGGWGLVLNVFNLALLPIFVFYLLRDWDRIIARVTTWIPPRHRPLVEPIAREIDARLSGFIRGQITVCLLLAVMYSLGLWLVARIDLPFLVGGLAGLLFLVPYLGTAFGIVLGTALALLKFGLDWHLLGVWGTFGVAQALEGYVITPRIVGNNVGLSPLVVIVALVAGGSLLGIWGMLVAIPVAASLSVILRAIVVQYSGSQFFRER